MLQNKIVWLKIEYQNYYNLIIKLNNIGINLYDVRKEKDYILILVNYKEYSKIKKYLPMAKINIHENTGFYKIKDIIKKHQVFLISIFLGIIILFIANNIVFRIDIKTNNKEIKELVEKELTKNGLKTLTLKKNHKEIENIIKVILDDNKDTLEWLEIEYDGLIMIVNVVEKESIEEAEEYSNCDIIASKDAKITSINIYKGEIIKDINDYVKKGDVILTGSIIYNEEVKNTVCAGGEVYGEVWYKAKITVPFKETSKKYTGKSRFNIKIKIADDNYKILKSRIDTYDEESINLYELNNFSVSLVKEKEYVLKTYELSIDEAYNKALELVTDKINLLLDEDEEILAQKVLKKEVNNSTIYLEVFIVTQENIGELKVVGEDVANDNSSNTKNSE